MSDIQRLSEDEVLMIRRRMATLKIATQDAFGHPEPMNGDKLSSAIYRQFTSGGGVYKYNTIHDVAANLLYGIAMSHAFENGNKRTALVSTLVFLDKNKTFLVNTDEDELYELVRDVAAHEIELSKNQTRTVDAETDALSSWIRDRIRPKTLGDKAMHFKDLKEQLEAFGCTFDKPDSNYIKIHRKQWVVKTGYPKANFELGVAQVKKIRKSLRLDEVHGIDSAGFYDLEHTVDGFVNQYRNLMKRLADL
ncbi:type II toxin-antitoxin system death-on-curing family toxin [Aeromonas crassostreae]